MTIGTKLYTMFNGECVGSDAEGNRYFQVKRAPKSGRRKRWVMYKGEAEASRVPPEWHAWLHHTIDHLPTAKPRPVKPWQKPYQPNRTGTTAAYQPPGHDYAGGKRDRATGDYVSWRPPS